MGERSIALLPSSRGAEQRPRKADSRSRVSGLMSVNAFAPDAEDRGCPPRLLRVHRPPDVEEVAFHRSEEIRLHCARGLGGDATARLPT